MINMEKTAEFTPSLLRLLARRIFIAIAMAVLVTSISRSPLPLIGFFVVSMFFIIEALYYTPPDPSRYLIVISSHEISGPTSNRNCITIPLDKIDVVKSHSRRNLYDSIYNIRRIQTNDREKIFVYCDAYPKDTFDQMLRIISDLKNDRARRVQNAQ